MKFIELTGKRLNLVINDEISSEDLIKAGVTDETVVRVNQQGDIEVRRAGGWDLVGGLLGDFEKRLKQATSLDWA